jgi:hypothetical protein
VIADDTSVVGATMVITGPIPWSPPVPPFEGSASLVLLNPQLGIWHGDFYFPTWPVPPGGTYNLSVFAVDAVGNFGVGVNRTFIFDPYPPTLEAWAVFPPAIGLGGHLNLSIIAADDGGVTSVNVFLAQAFAGSNATIGPVSLSLKEGTPLLGNWTGVLPLPPASSTEDGEYTVAVEMFDVGGNEILYTPVHVIVDQTPPDTLLLSVTDAHGRAITAGSSTRSSTATFTFVGTDDIAIQGFQCRLDGGEWLACASPTTVTGLMRGTHMFRIAALDEAGNLDPTPTTFTWTVR